MIDTGGSVCAAHAALLEHGANPDIYLVATHPVFSGPATEAFRTNMLTADELLAGADEDKEHRSTFGALHFGLELRLDNRIGASIFLEAIPDLRHSANLGSHLDLDFLDFQSLGMEVTFCY